MKDFVFEERVKKLEELNKDERIKSKFLPLIKKKSALKATTMYTEAEVLTKLKYFSDPQDVIEKADKLRSIGDELLFLQSQKRAYIKAINAGAVNETYLYEMIDKVHIQINSLEEQLRKL